MSTKLYVDMMTSDKVVRRRRYADGFKARVLAECDAPGASVAKVAMAHGINANVVHRWRQLAREDGQATAAIPSEFVPVSIAAPTLQPVRIRPANPSSRRVCRTDTTGRPSYHPAVLPKSLHPRPGTTGLPLVR